MASGRWDRELVRDPAGQTVHPDPECPVEIAIAAISGRWTTLVLRELMHGPLSFGELRTALPALSDKVLSERLTQLRAQPGGATPAAVVDRVVPDGSASARGDRRRRWAQAAGGGRAERVATREPAGQEVTPAGTTVEMSLPRL